MSATDSTQSPVQMTIAQALEQAVAHHRANKLQDAERLYRAILKAQPKHPDANHNLGVLAVQAKQTVASLPHFKAALEAMPTQGQFWISYVNALALAGRQDSARNVLAQGRQKGLQGPAVDALEAKLSGERKNLEPAAASASSSNVDGISPSAPEPPPKQVKNPTAKALKKPASPKSRRSR